MCVPPRLPMTWQLRVSWYPFALHRNLSNMIIIITTTVITVSLHIHVYMPSSTQTTSHCCQKMQCFIDLIWFARHSLACCSGFLISSTGHVTLVTIIGTTIPVPCIQVKLLKPTWRSGTHMFHLRVIDLQMSSTDLTTRQGNMVARQWHAPLSSNVTMAPIRYKIPVVIDYFVSTDCTRCLQSLNTI